VPESVRRRVRCRARVGRRYELVSAFEVFEHLVNPLEEIERMLRLSDSILFSTLLVPTPAPGLADWWY